MSKFYDWTLEKTALLEKIYANTSNDNLAKLFGCKVRIVRTKANRMGLKKSAEFLSNFMRTNPRRHRFSKGNALSSRPIGFERVDGTGYLWRKISDTRNFEADWKLVHHIVWQEHYGPVPEGRMIAFKDKNKQNFAKENLECITRADTIERMTVHRYPQELIQLMRLRKVVERKLDRKMEDEQRECE